MTLPSLRAYLQRRAVRRAEALLQEGAWEEAAERFEALLAREPRAVPLLHGLGIARMKLGRWRDAVPALARAAELEPERADIAGHLGMTHLALEAWEDAVDAYGRAVALTPDDFGLLEGLATAQYELGCWEEAIAACRRALAVRDDAASVHHRLGGACLETERLEEAAASLSRAVSLEPERMDALEPLARVLVRTGENARAVALLRDAAAVQPGVRERLGDLFAELGILDDEAVAEAWGRIEAEPDAVEPLERLGVFLAATGAWEEAVELLERAVTLAPQRTRGHRALAEAQAALGRHEEAAASFRRALHDPTGYDFEGSREAMAFRHACHRGLGEALVELGREDEAAEAFEEQLNVAFDPVRCVEIGRRFQRWGRDELATRAYVRAIMMNRHHLEAYEALGTHLEETGGYDEAATVYRGVLDMGLGDEGMRARLAELERRSGGGAEGP